jgi:hypothetical protein
MNITEALDDIGYIKSLCKEARDSLYSWKPYFLLFSVIWMAGMLVPSIPGVPSIFSFDGKHWPLLFLIGLVGTWFIKKKTKLPRIPFMMRILIWNWAILFFFSVTVLFWKIGSYSAIHMYNYWTLVVGVAFLMMGVTLQSRIGWIGVGFFGVSFLRESLIFKFWIFTPIHHIETPVIIGKAILGGLLLGLSWWLVSRSKAGATVG